MAPHELATLYAQLKTEFSAVNPDLQKCGQLLSKLKVGLVQAGLFLPQGDTNLDDLIITREILEIGAFWSIRAKDVPSFDRYFSQLQTFYNDFSSILPPSPRQYPVQGLNLIRLLTQNRIADFHTTLESLPPDALSSNPFIIHPVNLERWLMEGSYSKVWSAREEAPAEEYKFFVDSLMGTIRNEIASCEETAYDSLPVSEAAALLFFKSSNDLIQFAHQRAWQVDLLNQTVLFVRKDEEKVAIPKQKMIVAALEYAKELEQIV
ncbi:hypothetical protein BS47DRAFT_115590 [Hydnum rufescens UP504]|uniref:PCI domain-containing protein n=1 Tax=Hydnum rufescens UP504 TaxID=1448309 RepID=A0A9P6AS33_9AGAM|nr:hypothetical protein BS47DRAFT_115590 [Hydnum rufescens UP504]